MHLKKIYNNNNKHKSSRRFTPLCFNRLSGQPSPPAVAVLSDLAAETAYCSGELLEQCVDLVCLEGETVHTLFPGRFQLLSSSGHSVVIFVLP